jgi:hypothetical protein
MTPANREAWLTRAVERFNEGLFEPNGYPLPALKVSVGFPRGRKMHLPGDCETDTKDGAPQIFISPKIDNAIEALTVLAGMLIRARLVKNGADDYAHIKSIVGAIEHGGDWLLMDEMREDYALLAEELGPYPHSGVNVKAKSQQKGRLGIAKCPSCGAIAYVSKVGWEKSKGLHCGCTQAYPAFVLEKAPWVSLPF